MFLISLIMFFPLPMFKSCWLYLTSCIHVLVDSGWRNLLCLWSIFIALPYYFIYCLLILMMCMDWFYYSFKIHLFFQQLNYRKPEILSKNGSSTFLCKSYFHILIYYPLEDDKCILQMGRFLNKKMLVGLNY